MNKPAEGDWEKSEQTCRRRLGKAGFGEVVRSISALSITHGLEMNNTKHCPLLIKSDKLFMAF